MSFVSVLKKELRAFVDVIALSSAFRSMVVEIVPSVAPLLIAVSSARVEFDRVLRSEVESLEDIVRICREFRALWQSARALSDDTIDYMFRAAVATYLVERHGTIYAVALLMGCVESQRFALSPVERIGRAIYEPVEHFSAEFGLDGNSWQGSDVAARCFPRLEYVFNELGLRAAFYPSTQVARSAELHIELPIWRVEGGDAAVLVILSGSTTSRSLNARVAGVATRPTSPVLNRCSAA